jgi:hypothetical protein
MWADDPSPGQGILQLEVQPLANTPKLQRRKVNRDEKQGNALRFANRLELLLLIVVFRSSCATKR